MFHDLIEIERHSELTVSSDFHIKDGCINRNSAPRDRELHCFSMCRTIRQPSCGRDSNPNLAQETLDGRLLGV